MHQVVEVPSAFQARRPPDQDWHANAALVHASLGAAKAAIETILTPVIVAATDAERELKMVLILQMLSKKIGGELNCVVSGLTNFGIFVQCVKFGVEGLIEFGDLGLDEWKYDERAQAVVGAHSGKTVHLGQEMKVRIAAVNVAGRQLTLAPVKLLVSSRDKFNTPQNRKKARQSRKQRRGRGRR